MLQGELFTCFDKSPHLRERIKKQKRPALQQKKLHCKEDHFRRLENEILFFREIDNFFPAVFKYLNIREWDVEETDLLK